MNQIRISDLITEEEAVQITNYVRLIRSANGQTRPTVHNTVMAWLDQHPAVLERFKKHHVLKAYGAYLLEYYLKLS